MPRCPTPPCNIVSAWHGTPTKYVEAVCRDIPRAFRTTDGGFVGAGSYFAVELEYATRYVALKVCASVTSFIRPAALTRVCRAVLLDNSSSEPLSDLTRPLIADAQTL